MGQLVQAYIGLGANVGAPRETLEGAVSTLALLPGCSLAGVSRLYRTRPVGPVAQADFLNAVVALRVPAGTTPEDGAMALLAALKELERALGRRRRERWGPREVDLDLLLFGESEIHVEREEAARSADVDKIGVQWLDVPHASAAERSFVLAPWADLAPELVPPGWGLNVEQARARTEVREGPDAVTVVGEWDDRTGRWRDPGKPGLLAR